ncbi:MAG: aminoglycoside adenylyltransferase domain-containing protein [Nocardioides sp.]
MLPELDRQLDTHEAALLRAVLGALADNVQAALGHNLIGVYLKGSFALGAGDVHADVDFLVVTNRELESDVESKIRDIHRQMPTRAEHWAHVLEGSYATIDQLRERANPNDPWLYVDNGQTEMEPSTHDNTETFRWILKNRGLVITGPPADSLLPQVPTQALRDEAAALAVQRHHYALADPQYLENGWGQPHEVLTNCRMLYSASTGQVASKNGAARWCIGVLPTEWRELIEAAIADRPNPWERVQKQADSRLTTLTRRFIEDMKTRIAAAATGPLLDGAVEPVEPAVDGERPRGI